jgi:hypothetical protein
MMTSNHPLEHPYERDPHSGAGNCRCGWPDLWGEYPPPIHGGPSWRERAAMRRQQGQEPKSGLERVHWAIAEARGDHAYPTAPIMWDGLDSPNRG